MEHKINIAIHGGAGTILPHLLTAEKEKDYRQGLHEAIEAGKKILINGGTSLDAVSAAVMSLENNALFNAGKGSVFANNGKHEMDASIMNGTNGLAGAVAGITGVKNPIALARLVMEQTEHVMLIGNGAEEFAKQCKLPFMNEEYFHDKFRYNQWIAIRDSDNVQLDHSIDKKFGTVGAVAIDKYGNLAAATSTGGMTNKKYGRVGDTAIIGAGTYANNATCAISCTGHGEFFMRHVVAYDIHCLMLYKNLSLADACNHVLFTTLNADAGEGGLVAMDKDGNAALIFNSAGMYRASMNIDMEIVTEIYK